MGRPKGFSREEVLTKAIGLFWEKGFAETSLQDLERETGVNKSGLYTEFKDKQDIFLESLRHYLNTRGGDDILASDPKGWDNIERFLRVAQTCYTGRRGCFAVNSLRDITRLPPEANQVIDCPYREFHRSGEGKKRKGQARGNEICGRLGFCVRIARSTN